MNSRVRTVVSGGAALLLCGVGLLGAGCNNNASTSMTADQQKSFKGGPVPPDIQEKIAKGMAEDAAKRQKAAEEAAKKAQAEAATTRTPQ